MMTKRYICYIKSVEEISKNKFLVKLNYNYVILNYSQISVLFQMNENALTIEELNRNLPNISQNELKNFISYFLIRNFVFISNSNTEKRFIIYQFFRKYSRIYLSKNIVNKIQIFLINKNSSSDIKQNINFFKFFPIIILFTFYNFFYLKLDLNLVPRNIFTFMIGTVTAVYHEWILFLYNAKNNRKIGRIYLRIVYFVAITFGTEWGGNYKESKDYRINMFKNSIISIFYLSFYFYLFYYLLHYLNYFTLSYYALTYAKGIQIFGMINAYPFLLKTDGYVVYQELFGTYNVRSKFFKKLFYYLGFRDNTSYQNIVKTNNKFYMFWDMMFLVSIIALVLLLYYDIRIII